MKKLFVVYSGVTKKWRNKYILSYGDSKWVNRYAIEILEGILIMKEYNHSRCIDFKQLLKMQALVEFTLG